MCGINAAMQKPTLKQQKVLDFIRQRIKENMPPTLREIARAFGFSSTGTVRDYLHALEKKGFLTKGGRYMSRALHVPTASFHIPIIGKITAGGPDLAYEEIQGYIDADDLY